jgi:hypothetical protein
MSYMIDISPAPAKDAAFSINLQAECGLQSGYGAGYFIRFSL